MNPRPSPESVSRQIPGDGKFRSSKRSHLIWPGRASGGTRGRLSTHVPDPVDSPGPVVGDHERAVGCLQDVGRLSPRPPVAVPSLGKCRVAQRRPLAVSSTGVDTGAGQEPGAQDRQAAQEKPEPKHVARLRQPSAAGLWVFIRRGPRRIGLDPTGSGGSAMKGAVESAAYAARACCCSPSQFQGRISCSRVCGRSAIRSRTSASHA